MSCARAGSRMHLYVGEYASNRVFVHAGVVGWTTGRSCFQASAGPGEAHWSRRCSRGGPLLLRRIRRAGRARPRPSLCPPAVAPLGRWNRGCGSVDPRSFGSRSAERAAAGRPGSGHEISRRGAAASPFPAPGPQAVLALLEDTLPAQIDPEGSLRVLHAAVQSARILKGARGEAVETAGALHLRPGRDWNLLVTVGPGCNRPGHKWPVATPTPGQLRPCSRRPENHLTIRELPEETLVYDHLRPQGRGHSKRHSQSWSGGTAMGNDTSIDNLAHIVARELHIAQAAAGSLPWPWSNWTTGPCWKKHPMPLHRSCLAAGGPQKGRPRRRPSTTRHDRRHPEPPRLGVGVVGIRRGRVGPGGQ